MSKYGLIIDGEVREVFDKKPEFTAELMECVKEIPQDVEAGFVLNGNKYEKRKEQEVAYIQKRIVEYPAIGDQLDAIWKELNKQRLAGSNLVSDADEMLGQILSIKKKYPKTEA